MIDVPALFAWLLALVLHLQTDAGEPFPPPPPAGPAAVQGPVVRAPQPTAPVVVEPPAVVVIEPPAVVDVEPVPQLPTEICGRQLDGPDGPFTVTIDANGEPCP
ncbi:MAG: hypothetical protein ACLGI3_12325 [Actinomycetes bacterium]